MGSAGIHQNSTERPQWKLSADFVAAHSCEGSGGFKPRFPNTWLLHSIFKQPDDSISLQAQSKKPSPDRGEDRNKSSEGFSN